MKKIILILSIVLCFSQIKLSSQQSMFKKGDAAINATVGFGSVLFSGLGYAISVPPLAASFEYGILDRVMDKGSVGVGGYLGYSASKYVSYGKGFKYTNIIIGARGAFHYPFIKNLDTYTGLMVGFNLERVTDIGTPLYANPSSGNRPAWSWFAGGRYYFTKELAALAEIGYGIAWVNLGIAYKF